MKPCNCFSNYLVAYLAMVVLLIPGRAFDAGKAVNYVAGNILLEKTVITEEEDDFKTDLLFKY